MQRQIKLSEDRMNEIKEEIASTTPFISDLLELAVLKEEYRENKFENCFDELNKRYTHVRRARRDGNCFYRAFFFQLFEFFINNKESKMYESFLARLEGSKKELVESGIDEIVIEDFYDQFVNTVKDIKTVEKEKSIEFLNKALCNKDTTPYLIMFARFLAALYLK
mmetsp:Transcript_12363/g.8999  ORF Transcript_12363/g.8999 Transcript_12363/m.8999 type:complete len:166 (+) Transcript_12363:57-554(+)